MLQAARTVQVVASLPFVALFVVLVRPTTAFGTQAVGLAAYAAGFVLKWALAWWLLTKWSPSWLPGTDGVSAVAEVLPALMVSVFVFVLGSLFVVTQLATTIHSNRASLILLYDDVIQQAVVRSLVVAVATLGLALARPGSDVTDCVAAFAIVLVLATGFTLTGSAALLPGLITRVTAPRNFMLWITESITDSLSAGWTDAVVWRVGALGEMLRRGVRNGDSLQLRSALEGFDAIHEAYIGASQSNAATRVHRYGSATSTGWLAGEVVPALLSAGQEAIALDIASRDANAIATCLARFGMRAAEADHHDEFMQAVNGLCELATCTQQVRGLGLTNHLAEAVYGLAKLVQAGVDHLNRDAAAEALAAWALAVVYAMRHLGAGAVAPRHSHWTSSLALIGANGPFSRAQNVARSNAFLIAWTNKINGIGDEVDFSRVPPQPTGRNGGLSGVIDTLRDAKNEA